MKNVKILIISAIALILAGGFSSCAEKEKTEPPEEPLKEFCSCLKAESMDETIPFIDDFLAGQPEDLDDGKKLENLAAWLNEFSCINEAAIYCQSCIENPPTSKIAFSFDDNGTSKDFILDVLMNPTLKASVYHEPVELPAWDYFLPRLFSWKWDALPSNVLIINNIEDEWRKYMASGEYYYYSSPDIDLTKHSLLVVSGTKSNNLSVSDITGRLHRHGTQYLLNIEISRNDGDASQWAYAMLTDKLSDDIRIEPVISYRDYEGDDFLNVRGEKIYLGQQRQDKIFMRITPDDASMEQIQEFIESDVSSLRIWRTGGNTGDYIPIMLESKDGSRIPPAILESLKARDEVVMALHMYGDILYGFTNEILLSWCCGANLAYLEYFAKKYDCTIFHIDELHVSKTSKYSVMQLVHLLDETERFLYVAPNGFFFSHH